VLGARGNTKAKKLRQGGTVFVRVTTAPVSDYGQLRLKLKGLRLKNTDGLFGKSDPFFELSAKISSAGGLTWHPIHRSPYILNNLNPVWEEFTVSVNRIAEDGNLDKPILIEVWDWEKSGRHGYMGKFETSINGLIAMQAQQVVDPGKGFPLSTKKGKDAGTIVVSVAVLEGNNVASGFQNALQQPEQLYSPVPLPPPLQPPTMAPINTMSYASGRPKFTDYLAGGCELELTIAIDFTGSNGDPRDPGTLHYRPPDGQLNDYEKAITAVGGIIARYDTDQKFPVLGFGAKYNGVIQHCFQVGPTEELDGIGSVLEAYRSVFNTGLTMSGPTVFSEIINLTAIQARSKHEESQRIGKQSYKVLLILTDGEITDIEETKAALNIASDAPLSIVIVGIGNADFGAMQHLDDFQTDRGAGGRDIVQFVEFSQHATNRSSLTRATLEEIPDQMVDFFTSRGIMPFPPLSGSQFSIHASDATDEDIDLNIDIMPNGSPAMHIYNGPVYDDRQYETFSDYSSLTPVPVPPYQQPGYFLVQVPPNVGPGMQLQIVHPTTNQPMLVVVPPGLNPGDTFSVQQ
jgi:hypothetical protein